MLLVISCLFVLVSLLGWLNGRAGYSNGFHDGCHWFSEGDGYPSKPGPGWYNWDDLRTFRDRKRNR